MPIFCFRCTKCQTNFDILCLKADEVPTCPNQREGETPHWLERQYSGYTVGAQFKGSGFYQNDYAKKR